MPKPLLVELGCEEIPARMVGSLAQQFADNLNRHLKDAGLASEVSNPTVHWTPRRLLFLHPEVYDVQPVGEEQLVGPPARIAFTPDGVPTPQALGFAAKNNAPASSLFRLTTPKGDYVAVRKATGGGDALPLLSALIPKAFHEVQLPRSMRWGGNAKAGDLRFIRPLRWLLALHGDTLVPFPLGDLRSAPESRGHRTLGAARFRVASTADYPALWLANSVVPDPEERRARIRAAADEYRIRHDAGLEDTLVNLTEFPDVVVGGFDADYLQTLPAEVLVTVMRDHQKYFAVEDESGQLAPRFVTVINQAGDPQGLIRHGNERVLKARFSDARFFWEADRKLSLGERLPLLENVTFQVKLGSYREKSLRLRDLAAALARKWGCDEVVAATAAELAKCDLTTDMVKEFPELQGVMGGHYARAEGLSEAVAAAIADQYAWETPPRTTEGAAVSLADKLDTIAGMFSIGEIPTGSADPFGLRRQANGVIRTLIERELPLSLAAMVPATPELAAFFKERLSFYLRDVAGFAPETVAAVLAAGADDPLDAMRRCQALRDAPDMAAVAAVVKRAGNIVRKEKWTATEVHPSRLSLPAEAALYQAVAALPATLDYAAELAAISGLAAPLERFFAEARVNDDDPALRANRLSLLAWTVRRLSRLADFQSS